jgi:Ca-activated chloride channel family protein
VRPLLSALPGSLAFDALERPLVVPIALGLAAIALWLGARRSPPALPWPAFPEARLAAGAGRDWPRAFALALRGGALVLIGLALAGPVRERLAPPPPGEGLDIVLVLDTSGSMRAVDAEVSGAWRTRLDLAREVVARFARQRAAAGDRVALVVFGETAFTQCPLTADGSLLAAALEQVEAGMAGEATALGDAVALAVKRAGGGARPDSGAEAPAAGRIVVLLSDGRSNAGSVPTDVALALARERGVRVHTVGIGSTGEVPVARAGTEAGEAVRVERHDLDEATLRRISTGTDGRFFHARSSADLDAVYAEIDALERVTRREPPRRERHPSPEPLLVLAGLLIAGELVVSVVPGRALP